MVTTPKNLNSAQRVEKAIQDSLCAEVSYIYNNLLPKKERGLFLDEGEEKNLELYISQVTKDMDSDSAVVAWTFVFSSFNYHRYKLIKKGCDYTFEDITTEKDKRKIIANILNNETVKDRRFLKIGNKLMSESSISDIEEMWWKKGKTIRWNFSYHREKYKLVFSRTKGDIILENIYY